jgi:hypothetical protein
LLDLGAFGKLGALLRILKGQLRARHHHLALPQRYHRHQIPSFWEGCIIFEGQPGGHPLYNLWHIDKVLVGKLEGPGATHHIEVTTLLLRPPLQSFVEKNDLEFINLMAKSQAKIDFSKFKIPTGNFMKPQDEDDDNHSNGLGGFSNVPIM